MKVTDKQTNGWTNGLSALYIEMNYANDLKYSTESPASLLVRFVELWLVLDVENGRKLITGQLTFLLTMNLDIPLIRLLNRMMTMR